MGHLGYEQTFKHFMKAQFQIRTVSNNIGHVCTLLQTVTAGMGHRILNTHSIWPYLH